MSLWLQVAREVFSYRGRVAFSPELLKSFLVEMRDSFLQGIDRFRIGIHSDHADTKLIQREGKRESDISQSDDGNRFDFYFTLSPEVKGGHDIDKLSLLVHRDDVVELTGGNLPVAKGIMETRKNHIRLGCVEYRERITHHDRFYGFVQSVPFQDGLADVSIGGDAKQPVIVRDQSNPRWRRRIMARAFGDRVHGFENRGVRGKADGGEPFFHRVVH